MRIIVLQENLYKAVSFVSKNVTSKTQLPILNNVLLETSDGRLKITTTNLETTLSVWVGATIEEEGAITVPARFFSEVLSSFPKDKVFFEIKEATLLLKCGENEVSINGMDAKEFPPISHYKEGEPLVLPVEELGGSLSFVAMSAAQDEGRPLLTGVRFAQKKDNIEVVATDGFRLSVKNITLAASLTENFVISSRALVDVFRAAKEQDAKEVHLFFNPERSQARFVLPDFEMVTRLIEGEYPPYEKIIPSTHTARATFQADELQRAIKTAALFARDTANIIKITLGTDQATISANSPHIGKNKANIKAAIEGMGESIAFNARFLLDLLAVFPDNEISLEMTTPLAPGMFRSLKDPSFFHIIMPVRVQE